MNGMKIYYKCKNGLLTLSYFIDPSDKTNFTIFRNSYKTSGEVHLNNKQCNIHLPNNWNIDSVHPDMLALAAISIAYPFCGPVISVPIGVSVHFHRAFYRLTNKKIVPVNYNLKPRKAPLNAVPALSYSGGIDSTSALLLLPPSTHLFYIDRIPPLTLNHRRTMLKQEAAYFACDSLKKLGFNIHRIKTDLQYVRNPVGFNTILADAAPSLLLSDYYGFNSLANGHTIEEGYRVGYEGYTDWRKNPFIAIWSEILDSVDMPFTLPLIGLSEVSTTKMVMNSRYRNIAQACSRGGVGKPCMNCYKCFRKDLLEKTINNVPLTEHYLNNLFKINDANDIIKHSYPHFGNVLSYITSKYNGNHLEMNKLKKKVRGDSINTSWMEKFHPEALNIIAPQYRQYIKKQIDKYVTTMEENEINTMKTFYSVDTIKKL